MSHRTLLRPVRTAAALTVVAAAAFGLTACDKSDGGSDSAASSSASASATSGGQANAEGQGSDDAKPGDSATTGGSGTSGGSTGGSTGGSGTSGGSTGGSGAASRAAASAASKDASSDRCEADVLKLELGQGDAGAGNIRYPLSFTNTGKKSCTLRGYPGVALSARDGVVIGHPADREGPAGSAVTLAPGASAHAVLHTVNEGLKDGPCWKSADLVQVYAPGSKTMMTARASQGLRVCGNEFLVSALESGSGS
ncbi:DUF4232 domain-containing protein [Streptomyces sp. NPDC002067]